MVRWAPAVILLALLPSAAWAQRDTPEPGEVAASTAGCLTRGWAERLTGPAWVEELGPGHRVVVPLRGQPDRQEVLFRPPVEDTLAWFDLYRYDDFTRTPSDIPYLAERGVASYDRYALRVGDRAYVVYSGGYDWGTLRSRAAYCLEGALRAF